MTLLLLLLTLTFDFVPGYFVEMSAYFHDLILMIPAQMVILYFVDNSDAD